MAYPGALWGWLFAIITQEWFGGVTMVQLTLNHIDASLGCWNALGSTALRVQPMDFDSTATNRWISMMGGETLGRFYLEERLKSAVSLFHGIKSYPPGCKELNTCGQGRGNALYRLWKIWFNAGKEKNTVHIESRIVLVAFSNCAWFNIQKTQKVCPLCLSPSPTLRATNPCLEIHCQPLMIFRCSLTGEYASTTCGNHIVCFWLQLWRDRQHRDDCSSSSVWCWFPVFPWNL